MYKSDHRPLIQGLAAFICCAVVVNVSNAPGIAAELPLANRFEKEIAAMEQADAKAPPVKNGIVFVGSSSIRLWDLKKSFPDLPAVNRGFGGSQVSDSVHYADRIVTPLAPRVVVVYAGDNDIASGKSPEQVATDYQALVAKIHARLPEAKIVYIGIKPSIQRWKLIDKVRSANKLIREHVAKDQRLAFVDVEPVMLGESGQPKPELFQKDGLHLNAAGYEAWTAVLTPVLVSKAESGKPKAESQRE